MAYYTQEQLDSMNFLHLGENVKVSTKASLYDCQSIHIGDNSRIDDFCVISGKAAIGRNVHITPMCLIAGGKEGTFIDDFSTLAYGVKIFSQSDDYSGDSMTNSTIPIEYKNETFLKVIIEKYCIIGSGSTIMPGVTLKEGCVVGAMALVLRSTKKWGVYVGVPATRIKNRKKNLLEKLELYLSKRGEK